MAPRSVWIIAQSLEIRITSSNGVVWREGGCSESGRVWREWAYKVWGGVMDWSECVGMNKTDRIKCNVQ